jgi:tetratricopeptide (TPR) repeat protein
VTAAEAAGRLDEAEAIWTRLAEPDQALRCRVTHLERAGQVAAVAALLEERGLLEAAALAWARAGEPGGQARCEARRLERRKRWDEAARCWTSLGEAKEAARCQGRFLMTRGEYARAADAFTEAGDAESALQMRIFATQMAGNWDGAIALAQAAGRADLAHSLRRQRDARPAGRGAPARRPVKAAPGPGTSSPAAPRSRPVQGALFPVPDPALSDGPGVGRPDPRASVPVSPTPASLHPARAAAQPDPVVAAVERHPGLRSPEVAALTGLGRERVQALLRQAVAAGVVVKSGATRGTRYWPAGSHAR